MTRDRNGQRIGRTSAGDSSNRFWAQATTPKKGSEEGTKFEEEADEADELTIALLQKKDKKWVLVEHGYFTTDVWWIDLWERHKGSPKTIFEKPLR